MARYTELYWDAAWKKILAQTGQESQVPPGGVSVDCGIFLVEKPKPCLMCNHMTPFVVMVQPFKEGSYLCSEECLKLCTEPQSDIHL
jgi:hypothetical protein